MCSQWWRHWSSVGKSLQISSLKLQYLGWKSLSLSNGFLNSMQLLREQGRRKSNWVQRNGSLTIFSFSFFKKHLNDVPLKLLSETIRNNRALLTVTLQQFFMWSRKYQTHINTEKCGERFILSLRSQYKKLLKRQVEFWARCDSYIHLHLFHWNERI